MFHVKLLLIVYAAALGIAMQACAGKKQHHQPVGETASPALDTTGVVIDSDRDGIPDTEDKCPATAGTARYGGCPVPDTDGDGVNDELDNCPGEFGDPQAQGCPRRLAAAPTFLDTLMPPATSSAPPAASRPLPPGAAAPINRADTAPQASIAYAYRKKIPLREARYIRVTIDAGQSVLASKSTLSRSLGEETAKELRTDDTSTVEGFLLPSAKYFFIQLSYDTAVFSVAAERPDTQQLDAQGKIEWRWRVFGKVPVRESQISLDVFSANDRSTAFRLSSETIGIQVAVSTVSDENPVVPPPLPPKKPKLWPWGIAALLAVGGAVAWWLWKREKRMKQKIYFSYAWLDDPTKATVVNQMYESLRKAGFNVLKDKVDLRYRGSITSFMKEIGKADFAIIIISDKYLKSKYCMFELLEIYLNCAMDTNRFRNKIFPVMIEDIQLGNPAVQMQYSDYWEANEAELESLLKTNIDTLTDEQAKQFQVIRRIVDEIGTLLPVLADLNALTIQKLLENDFAEMKISIEKAIRS